MTRKDFELIANIIWHLPYYDTRVQVSAGFANVLKAKYPNFDKEKFVKACLGDKKP